MPALSILFLIAIMFFIKMGLIMLAWWLFMEPVFGLPGISILEALGLNLLMNLHTLKLEINK